MRSRRPAEGARDVPDGARAERGRVGVVSLGCPKNLVDTEIMLGELERRGYRIVADAGEADTVIVNTCGFIEEAKQESIDAILELAAGKEEAGRRLLVAGCMVNRYGAELAAEIPEIDGFVGLDELREVADRVAAAHRRGAPAGAPDGGGLIRIGDTGAAPPPAPSHLVFDHTAPRRLTTRGYAYLKVAEGCDNPCTFCAIPKWRGRFRSRTVESLVAEARALEESGPPASRPVELCLIAQDTTRYGGDLGLGRHGMVRLVEALLAATSFPWIRFLYAYPTTLDPDLLRLMGSEERFVSYLDMPLQHSDPEMLKAMRRGGNARRYLRQLETARTLAPDVFLRTTFIVGFPGETEERFEHLLEFVRESRFDHLGAFAYSPEPGTPAAELPGRVPKATARRRYERLLAEQEPIARERRRRLVGLRMPALVEGVHEETEHLLVARHHGQAPEIDGRILINDGAASPGTLAEVEITDAYADDLVGRVVGPAGVPGVTPAPDLAAVGAAAG
jgi:ribosomal protein S12 methylthiotransferase